MIERLSLIEARFVRSFTVGVLVTWLAIALTMVVGGCRLSPAVVNSAETIAEDAICAIAYAELPDVQVVQLCHISQESVPAVLAVLGAHRNKIGQPKP